MDGRQKWRRGGESVGNGKKVVQCVKEGQKDGEIVKHPVGSLMMTCSLKKTYMLEENVVLTFK